jgi:uncharacterized protein YkwD
VDQPRETVLIDEPDASAPRRAGRRRRPGGLLPPHWRPGQVGIAALAAGVLVAIGLGFAVLSPLLAGPQKPEALPVTSDAPDRPVPSGGASVASPGPSLLRSLPPATRLPGSKPGDLEDQLVSLVNQARSQAGCHAVKDDGHLHNSARGHSDDMARKGYVSRTGSDGSSFSDRIRKAGYHDPLGEDVGSGYQTAQQALDAWLATADQKAPLVNCDAKAIGVGVSFAKDGTVYWTADLGH